MKGKLDSVVRFKYLQPCSLCAVAGLICWMNRDIVQIGVGSHNVGEVSLVFDSLKPVPIYRW